MIIKVLDIIKSKYATNLSDGSKVYDNIKLYNPSEISISFKGISRISTLFLNECIGQYAINHPTTIGDLKFIYPVGKQNFSLKVDDVIENALLGDEYDVLVDNAQNSI